MLSTIRSVYRDWWLAKRNVTFLHLLCGKYNDFKELREILQEIIDAWSLRRPPTVLTLFIKLESESSGERGTLTHVPHGCHEQIIDREDERVWFLVARRKRRGEQLFPYWFIEILNEAHKHVESA